VPLVVTFSILLDWSKAEGSERASASTEDRLRRFSQSYWIHTEPNRHSLRFVRTIQSAPFRTPS
jgi:hypothetical protein